MRRLRMIKTILWFFFLALPVLSFGKKKFTIAVNMIPEQFEYFEKKIVKPFEKSNKCEIHLLNFRENAKIPGFFDALPKDAKGKKIPPLGLIMIPHEMTRSIIKSGKLLALDEMFPAEKIREMHEVYFLSDMYLVDKKTYILPRKLETRLLVYRKSKVRDAVQNWKRDKVEINALLKKENGMGLPVDYKLEVSPALWDFYDLFVVGYYWSHSGEPAKREGKIAHRGKRYSGTVTGMMDRVIQCGGNTFDLLSFEREPTVDMFTWECLFLKSGMIQPDVWEKGWSGFDIWQGFKDEKVYLSFMTQIDCFFLAGGKKGKSYVEPKDLGISVMPRGGSIALTKDGSAPLRKGKSSVSTGGWWWGIPKDTKKPKLSYQFIEYVTSLKVQSKECGKFGIFPVRLEMIINPSSDFGPFTREVYKVSKYQLTENGASSVATVTDYEALEKIYLDAFYDLCVKEFAGKTGKNRKVDFELIKKALALQFGDALSKIK